VAAWKQEEGQLADAKTDGQMEIDRRLLASSSTLVFSSPSLRFLPIFILLALNETGVCLISHLCINAFTPMLSFAAEAMLPSQLSPFRWASVRAPR
jgi:hypothetical protein